MIEALVRAYELKALERAGWLRDGVGRAESVAAHSWGVALLVLHLLPESLDRALALSYAVLHDQPEAVTGDLTPDEQPSRARKIAAEHDALLDLLSGTPRADALTAVWERYEAQQDPESRFVRQLDRLDMALQALVYARSGELQPVAAHAFLDSAESVVVDAGLVHCMQQIRRAIDAI